jgi:hypothetical protein
MGGRIFAAKQFGFVSYARSVVICDEKYFRQIVSPPLESKLKKKIL